MEKIFHLNPGLTKDKGLKLIEDTTSYLINATDAFRLEEVIRSLDHLLKITDPASEDIQQLLSCKVMILLFILITSFLSIGIVF
jgi:hypothetical protein